MNTQQPIGDGKTTCLVCGREMPLTRGLCRSHHKHFSDSKKTIEISGGDSKQWEAEVIKRGLILADGRPPKNVFMEIYEDMGSVAKNINNLSTNVGNQPKPAPKKEPNKNKVQTKKRGSA